MLKLDVPKVSGHRDGGRSITDLNTGRTVGELRFSPATRVMDFDGTNKTRWV
jgi:hypothetical protein